MDLFEAISKECDEKTEQLSSYLANGSAKSYEEYQRLCGQIAGLLYAKEYTLSLKHKWENDDE